MTAATTPRRDPLTLVTGQPRPADDRGTLTDLFVRNHVAFADVGAIIDGEVRLTWGEYGDLAGAVALALDELGIGAGDVIGFQQVNRHEHVVGDVAGMLLRATTTSFYNTLAQEQLAYVVEDSATRLVVIDADRLDTWLGLRDSLTSLEHIVVLDLEDAPDGVLRWVDLVERGQRLLTDPDVGPARLEVIRADRTPDDLLTLIYTSGTTGPPKGVKLTHGGVRFCAEAAMEVILDGVTPDSPSLFRSWLRDGRVVMPAGASGLSYLPLAHIMERVFSHYIGMLTALEITYVRDLLALKDHLPEARPFVFPAVPRVWEKFHSAIHTRIEEADSPVRRLLGRTAMQVANAKGQAMVDDRRADLRTELLHPIFERIVYRRMREALGLDACLAGFSGAAPIGEEILHTFTGLGIPIVEAYGMTESSAVISMTPLGRPRVGTVGIALADTEVRIAPDGEILARGPHVTAGYLNRPEATAEAIDQEGWLHTGDLGEFDEAGYLKIIGRKKELIITSGGKNLSPNAIEESIKSASPIIGQVLAYGDRRNYVSALVVLDVEAMPAWCEARGIAFDGIVAVATHPDVVAEVERAVADGNSRLARVEQVKRWAVLPDEWTPETGELTPTMKIKRPVIHERYKDEIEQLYV